MPRLIAVHNTFHGSSRPSPHQPGAAWVCDSLFAQTLKQGSDLTLEKFSISKNNCLVCDPATITSTFNQLKYSVLKCLFLRTFKIIVLNLVS